MSEVTWDMRIDINRKMDHYEAYIDGKFLCSGDTVVECAREVEKYLSELREAV